VLDQGCASDRNRCAGEQIWFVFVFSDCVVCAIYSDVSVYDITVQHFCVCIQLVYSRIIVAQIAYTRR
jgi:hypothetical protein